MKEKINQFAKGIFEYDTSKLEIAPSELKMTVESGENCEGSFVISNSKRKMMKGVIVTDCHYIELEEDCFCGIENTVKFRFCGRTFMPGEVFNGTIRVISDCGSGKVTFTVNVGVPSCTVSSGKIKDLFHFSNLARENSDEAVQLFKNKHFEDVFLYRDSSNIALYRGLIAGTSKGLAMEEFLIAIHKKLPIQIAVDKTSFSYDNCVEKFKENITITKDNWGIGEFHVVSDTEFLVPERKIVWTDNFSGNKYPLSFTVDPDKMVPGRNYGRITIKTVRQSIDIEVMAVKPGVKHEVVVEKLEHQKAEYKLVRLYLYYRMNKIEQSKYVSELEQIVSVMESHERPVNTKLFKVYLGIISGNSDMVNSGLRYLDAIKDNLLKDETKLYCAYQYLKGLWSEDNAVKDECVNNVRYCYEKKDDSWQILWFMLYLDPVYEYDRRKFDDVLTALSTGCNSPVLYMEICDVLNAVPELLKELNPAVIRCLHWGCREKYVDKELALRYVYLAGRLKNYSRIIFEDLCAIYDRYKEEETLAVICRTLMKGQRTSEEAFKWYSLGIEHNLKITDLYEYYMYSIDETKEIRLNHSVLLYFLYDNHLTVVKKAMLYAYIINNKNMDSETYEAYSDIMKEFCFSQLMAGRISENLQVIYEEFINEECVDEKIAAKLPDIMFCQEIKCCNKDIVGVYIRHRELKEEEFVPLVNGRAIVHIFTENSRIFLADALDNRYSMSIDYTIKKMLNLDHLADRCFEFNKKDKRLLLYLYDRAENFHQIGPVVTDVRKRVIEITEISDIHRRKVFATLVRYYYDNFEGDLLDAFLKSLDWSQVNSSDRGQFIEYCAVRHCYDKAMEGILLYGYDKVSAKRLLQISSDTFKRKIEVEDKSLIKLAWHIFKAGKFDENVLKYLCRYFSAGIREMVQVWQVAHGFDFEDKDYEERIIAQAIFTEEIVPEAYEVFYSYYETGINKRLIQAFIRMNAYNYLLKKWIIPDKIFDIFYQEVRTQENMPCLIAVLKYFSNKKSLTEDEKNFADYNLNVLYEKNIIFPFFKNFYEQFPLPISIMDEHYVEYIADPKHEVQIHYKITSEDKEAEFVTETMNDVYEGIRVKSFVMFQDEHLQYYITETGSDSENKTKQSDIHFDETMDDRRASSRYQTINLMLIAKEINDDATLIEMMEEYARRRETEKMLFKML